MLSSVTNSIESQNATKIYNSIAMLLAIDLEHRFETEFQMELFLHASMSQRHVFINDIEFIDIIFILFMN